MCKLWCVYNHDSISYFQDQYQFVHRCVAHYARKYLNIPDDVPEKCNNVTFHNCCLFFLLDKRRL